MAIEATCGSGDEAVAQEKIVAMNTPISPTSRDSNKRGLRAAASTPHPHQARDPNQTVSIEQPW